jgi:serine/threonine-protein kinase
MGEMFRQIVDALAFAHEHGVFHRDLKPTNIILSSESQFETAQLIDFGLSTFKGPEKAITMQGRTIVGTPDYMNPDQLSGIAFTSQSEIYSLGCLMFETLSGQVPFKGETALETLSMHANSVSPKISDFRTDIPEHLVNLIDKCLSKRPVDRFQTMNELSETLKELELHLQAGQNQIDVPNSKDQISNSI